MSTATSLSAYLQDHLVGAAFTVQLLAELQQHADDARIRAFADELLPEVESDRQALQELAAELGDEPHDAATAAESLAESLSRGKRTPNEALGAFEALEALSLGVLGKLALWKSLTAIREEEPRVDRLDLARLAVRATEQHAQIEQLRLALAPEALLDPVAP